MQCLRINATFVENKCNFLTFLLQQKLALVFTLHPVLDVAPLYSTSWYTTTMGVARGHLGHGPQIWVPDGRYCIGPGEI